MSLVYAATSPTIQIYFMRMISSEVLAAANIVGIGLAAMVNSTISSVREFYHKWFLVIVVVDVICFCLISFLGINYPSVRFFGFAVLNAVSTTLWVTVMRDAVNGVLRGEKLTEWQACNNAFELYGAFLGGLAAIFIFDTVDIELCVLLQCLANMVMGVTDLIAYKELKKVRRVTFEDE